MANIVDRAIESFKRIGDGLRTVLMHSFREPITKEYPDQVPDLPAHFRGRLALTVNPESGDHLCISCRQCERVCPDKCIEITAHKSPETNKLELINFKIDHGLCMFCGLCTEVCPTSCIINTNDFEMSDYSREALVYDLRRLTLSQEESAYYFDKKEIPLPKPKPKPAPKPAAGAASKAATGAASKAAAGAAAGAASKAAAGAASKAAAKPEEKAEENKPEAKAEEKKPEAKADEKPPEAKAEATKPEAKADEAKPEVKAEEKKPETEAAKPEAEEKPKSDGDGK